jgi:GT2 family glycosyltransferase
MVTKLLHLCGLYLGQEGDLMPSTPDNPDGFWENVKFVELNEKILSELGGGWDFPPSMPDRWDEERFLHLKARAEVLLREFSDHEPWGWKDPRNNLTLPFWLGFFPKMKIIICLRNPIEVALSLHRRNFLSYSLSMALWNIYNKRVLEFALPEHRLITHYDAYFHDPQAELRRILDFLNMSVPEEVLKQCSSATKANLRHYRFTTQHLLNADVPPDVFNLYRQMCAEASRFDDGAALWVATDSSSALRYSQGQCGSKSSQKLFDGQSEEVQQLNGLVVEVELLRRKLEALQPELAARDARICELESMLKEQASLAQHTAEELGQPETEIRKLQEQLKESQREHELLLQTVVEQAKQLSVLVAKAEVLSIREDELRAMLLDASSELDQLLAILTRIENNLLRRDDLILATLYDLQAIHAEAQLSGTDVSKHHNYQQLIRHIREVVRATLPRDATVIVVSKGDDELLKLYGQKAWHFPQTADGKYAGYYPASSTAAIANLEVLRAKGGDFLLFPSTAMWWLNHYVRFKCHLERQYRVMVRQEDACVIFALREPAALRKPTWWIEFEKVIAEYQSCFDRDPAILDWNTGLELVIALPQYAIFSPPTNDQVLPYLDHSIDIVVVSSSNPVSVTEANRVAKAAVVIVTRTLSDVEPVFLLTVEWKLDKAETELPTTSIIIPCYNRIAYTEACLTALRETLPHNFRGEIIVVDDASTDETATRLKHWSCLDKRLKILRNQENAGFITSCNRGARAATGEIIIFLNNDTLPLPGWLPPLLQIFHDYPKAGAVGGKLLYPDGRLQEAGGIIFSDGSGANFGKGDYDPDAPLYNYVREVDYCSGALLATKRSLFEELGGFDTYYCPAYYEDTDYCFKLCEKGYRVYYQPESAIVHFEGATSGTDLSSGVKRYQNVNRLKFVERWNCVLKRQPPPPSQFDLATWHALAVCSE